MFKRLLKTIRRGILPGLVGSALSVSLFLFTVPLLSGGEALTVLSNSMSPGIPAGSMVFVRPVSPRDVNPGDIITFVRPETESLVTHRVMTVVESSEGLSFVTKGDANQRVDSRPVPATALRGRRWFSLPVLGGVRSSLAGSRNVLAAILLGVAALGFVELRRIAGIVSKRRPDAAVVATRAPTPFQVRFLRVASLGILVLVVNGEVGTSSVYSDFEAPAAVDLQAGAWETPPTAPDECTGLTFDAVIVGTSSSDVLYGDRNGGASRDLIFGLAGDDTIYGLNQSDCLVGGDGADVLRGGNGRDTLVGGTGKDELDSDNGADRLYGNEEDDDLYGGRGPDLLDGGSQGTTFPGDFCDSDGALDLGVNCESGEASGDLIAPNADQPTASESVPEVPSTSSSTTSSTTTSSTTTTTTPSALSTAEAEGGAAGVVTEIVS